MDLNKLKVLQDLPYKIHKVCGICKNGRWKPNTDWGTCMIILYNHKKHTTDERELSIHKYGSCPKFEYDEHIPATFGLFQEFIE
jgi:hypothetical protein